MKPMKTLVFGGSGALGCRLVEEFKAEYTYLNNYIGKGIKIDIRDRTSVLKILQKTSPDLVIHAAAAQSMDICETEKNLAYDIHVRGTENIVEGSKKINAKIVFISTSAVFDGKKKIYTENDETCPISYYGITKSMAEKIILESDLDFLINRIDHPYGWLRFPNQKSNTVLRVLDKLEKKEIVEEITDWYNNPTLSDNIVKVIRSLLEKDANGIYNVAGPDFINRYEVALKVAEIFDKDSTLIRGKEGNKLNLPAKRTNCNLDSTKAQKKTGIKLLDIDEGLKVMKKTRT